MSPPTAAKKGRISSASDFEVKIGPPKLTRFEKARIVGARSLQIAMGAPSFVPLVGSFRGAIEIATAELREGALPISIRRALPNGVTQDIPINALQE
ncbi:MAG TPA: DNA-directed RNA polymerase subunit K [Nitrososphaerales archaeon]|nr:DNA-directed RNA polymerase subunit K [Nitrososphaerales archaeon]